MVQATDAVWISVLPDMSRFGKEVEKAAGQQAVQAGDKAGQSSGRGWLSGFGKVVKRTAVGVGVAAGGALGVAITKGIGRMTNIEDATAKLRGLGHSAESVASIMDNALSSVKGTAFGLDTAATVAAGVVAAGIKPGKDLERVLRLVGDAATIAGADMGEMGAIFNKVAASNRLGMEEINQLQDRGIPILQMLAKHYGVSVEELRKMVSKGKVDFKAFSKAMEDNIGGAALESGNTTRGAFANMWAAVSRFGASLVSGVFPLFKQVFGGITEWIDRATSAVGPFVEALSGNLGAWWEANGPTIAAHAERIGGAIVGFVKEAVPVVRDFVSGVLDRLGQWWAERGPGIVAEAERIRDGIVGFAERAIPVVKGFVEDVLADLAAFWEVAAPKIEGAIKALKGVVEEAFKAISDAVLFVLDNWDKFKWAIIAGVAIMAPHWVALQVQATVASAKVALAWVTTQVGAIKAAVVHSAQVVAMVGRWVFLGVQSMLHAAKVAAAWLIAMGPIPLIIAAVAGLVALIIIHWDTIKDAISKAATWVLNFLKKHWPTILAIVTGPIGLIVLAVVKNWDTIKSTISKAWDAVRSTTTRVWSDITGWLGRTWDSAKQKAVDVFNGMVDGIRSAWDKLREAAAKPVRFVVDTVFNNGLIKAYNWIADKVPGIGTISPISIGFATGGWTGPGGKFQPAGIVHADEFVIRKESRRKLEQIEPGLLDFMNRYGRMPGYAFGGRVRDAWDKTGGKVVTGAKNLAIGAKDFVIGQLRKAAEKLVNPLIDQIPAGFIGDIAKGAARGLADAVFSFAGKEDDKASNLAGSTTGLDPEFLRRFRMYSDAVGGLRIVSGFRSSAQQAVLYDRWLRRVPGQAPAAPPGRSKHERGLAIDHAPHSTAGMRAIARTFGLRYPMSYEPWHVEPFDAGGWLKPGHTFAVNNTGRPERVLTSEQYTAIGRALEGKAETSLTVNAHSSDLAAEIVQAIRREHWMQGAV